MIFQSPLFLWALALLIIPVIVHLFDFRQVKTIRFSNVIFLDSLKRRNTPRKNFKNLLLLSARILALALIILCFADPVSKAKTTWNAGDGSMLIDNSYSLKSNCESSDCLGEISGLALALSKRTMNSGAVWLSNWYNFKSFFGTSELQSHLADIRAVKGEFLFPKLTNENVFLFSDFQNTVVEKIQAKLADSTKFTLVPVDRKGENNVRINTIQLTKSASSNASARKIQVAVSNNGETRVEGVLIRLVGDGSQLGSTAVSLGPNEIGRIEFEIDDLQRRNFEIEVEDYETPFDNNYFFVLPEHSPINVSVVSTDKSRSLAAVFGNKDLFKLDVFDKGSVNFEKIFSSDLLILDSFERLPEWFELERIEGDVVIIPSQEIDIDNYSSILERRVNRSSDTASFRLSAASIEHPFFNGIFNDLDSRVDLPNASSLYSLAGGDPLLTGRHNFLTFFEDQKLYWFASPLEEPFSEIENHSIFLPLMYRMAESSRAYNEPLSYELNNSPLEINVQSVSEAVPVLVNETGRFIPELNYSGSKLIFTLPPDLNEPGIYHLVSGSDTLKTIALNIPLQESKMDFRGYEELVEYFKDEPNVRVLDARSLDTLEASIEELDSGERLWKYGLILALMFLLAETAIHRWMK